MFIFTAKLHKGRLILGIVGLILACGIFTAAAGFHSFWSTQTVSAQVNPTGVKTNEDRVAFLQNYGWTVSPEALSVEELRIPDTFDESFHDYLAMQSTQGFDLSKYTGKKIKRYTYEVLNYPTAEPNVQASLLIYKNTVIGGEVYSQQDNGFIHGLDFPK